MSGTRPQTAAEMIAWLRAHPREPFFTLWSASRLVVGTRNDDGELSAWVCTVEDDAWELDRDPSRSQPVGITADATATPGTEALRETPNISSTNRDLPRPEAPPSPLVPAPDDGAR